MPDLARGRKRKAVTHDAQDPSEIPVYDEIGRGPLNGTIVERIDLSELSGAEGESELEDVDGDLDFEAFSGEDFDPDERSEDGQDSLDTKPPSKTFAQATDANGNPRYIYEDIDPIYDSDESDAPVTTNTIGNIPLSFYDSYPHIGYDINGKKLARPARGAALDSLLDSIDIPEGWTGLTNPETGKPLDLNEEQLDMLKRLIRNEAAGDEYDPYPDMIEYFTSVPEQMPLSAAPEPKRRFIPSKHEAKRVMKIAKAIREGRIQPYKPIQDFEQDEDLNYDFYDLWEKEVPRQDHPMFMPAPKLPPPVYEESYHPPPEYLPDEQESKEWQDADEEDRIKDYLPTDYDALRKVPAYASIVKEKFERSLDLYLAPRIRRSKLDIDPELLLPKLDDPSIHRPFPEKCDVAFQGSTSRVRSIAFSPNGEIIAAGGDDGYVRLWDSSDHCLLWSVKLSDNDPVYKLRWRPDRTSLILAVAIGDNVFLIAPAKMQVAPSELAQHMAESSQKVLTAGASGTGTNGEAVPSTTNKESVTQWQKCSKELRELGVLVRITFSSNVTDLSWHRRGDYFATVAPQSQRQAVAIHTLSKHFTQVPFRRFRGFAQCVRFHPLKPIFFVATQRTIQCYDLVRQQLVKTLQPGARWISSFDVHQGGDNLIVSSFDKKTFWLDLDLSTRPYKVFRFHSRGVRAARFHPGAFQLFADVSDDGTIQVFHGRVNADLMENTSITPLTVLRGHEIKAGLGVMDVDWHPTRPCCVTAGADGTCRVWDPSKNDSTSVHT